jgi:hypothetical protein
MENAESGAQPQSFQDRKRAELAAERPSMEETAPQPDLAPIDGNPEPMLESAEAGQPESDQLSEQEAQEPLSDAQEALYDENPSGDLDGDPEHDTHDWQKRFEDTQRKLSEVTENRRAMEQELTDMTSSALGMRHQLEDSLTEAKRYAEVYKQGFNGQIAQLEQAFSQGMIEPDNLPAARQQYQQLINSRNQVEQQVQMLAEQEKQASEQTKQRQAELARLRLQRTIPNWSREKYEELGSYAQSRGYTAEEFGQSLDYRFLELLNDSMQLRNASKTVEGVRRERKTSAPRQNARQQPRSADGKFRKAESEFWNNPNQRGRFAAMKAAQLNKERGR